ncbi:hypothetical protein [Planococcus lenghuensis]|uniref:Uncharacterized protein n=1 Tax=Planococcus lenghuensis TaxID=2213202 RepID=A0A1Q2KYY5_9BACL|nr:hypothetical protein [Planococcus lenghuensis]AQQ53409.1 hypothetical protein B0X71_10210 [Planococcus lenghuensis]
MRNNDSKRYRRGENFSESDDRPESTHSVRDGGHGRSGHHKGAKTFRRGRAIEFLERMNTRRETLKQQLETPELQSINPILVGELKALETVIAEFTRLFELHPDEGKQNGPVLPAEATPVDDKTEA